MAKVLRVLLVAICIASASCAQRDTRPQTPPTQQVAWVHLAIFQGLESVKGKPFVERRLRRLRCRWSNQTSGIWFIWVHPEDVEEARKRLKGLSPRRYVWHLSLLPTDEAERDEAEREVLRAIEELKQGHSR